MLEALTPGQELRIDLLRDGKPQTLRVRAEVMPDAVVAQLLRERLGVELRARARRAAASGARGAQGRAARRSIGIQPGDLMLGINGRPLDDDAEDLRRAVLDLSGPPRALVVVQRGRGRYHVTIPLGLSARRPRNPEPDAASKPRAVVGVRRW